MNDLTDINRRIKVDTYLGIAQGVTAVFAGVALAVFLAMVLS